MELIRKSGTQPDLNFLSASGYLSQMEKPLSLLRQIRTAPGTDEALIFDDAFNATEFGVREWLKKQKYIECEVTPNLNPLYSITWLTDEVQRPMASKQSQSRIAADFDFKAQKPEA